MRAKAASGRPLQAGGLWYSSHETLIGRISAAAHEGGVADLTIGASEKEFISSIRDKYGIEPAEAGARLRAVFEELDRYFAGAPTVFSAPIAPLGTAFEKAVWRALTRIPWGQCRSYAEVASMIGRPKGARAVGNACGANPVPVIIPCHRVVRGNGSLGGYSGAPGARGMDMKATLLRIEGVILERFAAGAAR